VAPAKPKLCDYCDTLATNYLNTEAAGIRYLDQDCDELIWAGPDSLPALEARITRAGKMPERYRRELTAVLREQGQSRELRQRQPEGLNAPTPATPERSIDGGHEKLPGDGHEAARWRT